MVAGLLVHGVADGVDLDAHVLVDELLDHRAGIRVAVLLAVGDEDNVALAFRSEVVDGLLEAVGDGGVALGLDGIDLCGEARDVEGADGVGELGVDAGQLPVLAGVGGAVDAQADLGVGGERRDRGGEGLF